MADRGSSRGGGQSGPPDQGNSDLLPSDAAMEKSFLGFMLIEPSVIAETRSVLSPEDFVVPKHAEVYDVFVKLHMEQELTSDSNLLSKALVASKTYPDTASAKRFISGLLDPDSQANPMYASKYADTIHALATQRSIVKLSWELPGIVRDSVGLDMKEVLDKVEAKVYSVTQRDRERSSGLVEIGDCLEEIEARLQTFMEGGVLPNGLPTGVESLDAIISGFKPGNLVILAARPAQGKTAVAVNIAYHVAAWEHMPVAFFSLEMGRGELTDRLLNSVARVNGREFNNLYYKLNAKQYVNKPRLQEWTQKRLAEELRRIMAAKEHIRKLPLLVEDTAGTNLMDISSSSRRLAGEAKNRYGSPLGLIVIDYLQLMNPVSKRAGSNRQEEVAEISRGLKLIAKELKVPILALAQVGRQVEQRTDKRPQLSDLRESGAIEQDADIVMFISRPYAGMARTEEDTDESLAIKNMQGEIIVAKHRSGPTGDARVIIDDSFTLFRSIPAETSFIGTEEYIKEYHQKVHVDKDFYFTVPASQIPPELSEFRRSSAESAPTVESVAEGMGLYDEPETSERAAAPEPVRAVSKDDDFFDAQINKMPAGPAGIIDAFFDDDDDDESVPATLEPAE